MRKAERPRVLFVSYTSEATGPTNSLSLLLDGLRDDHQISVLLPGDGPFASDLGLKRIQTHSVPSITKIRLFELAKLIKRERVDLVYANTSDGTSRVMFAAARLAGSGYVCHVRAMEWDKSWADLGHLRLADEVLAVSRAAADSVRRFVPENRLTVVYNGVSFSSADDARSTPTNLRRELGLGEEACILLSVAHVCPRKGQDRAIDAMSQLASSTSDVHLVLIGALDRDPDYVAGLEDAVRRDGLEDRVHLLGFRSDAAGLLPQANVFVHTALTDPHPRAVLEAMAAGRPVVAFGVDGVAETIAHGATGLLADPSSDSELPEAILSLVADRDTAQRMGEAGRRVVEQRFTEASVTQGVRSVIQRVLANRSNDRKC